ncbi:uncharacterized protein F5Z01DRAFT_617694 [Emericellopsis atlantica]|uniref:KOW domain-containing protein n=1 Tax=Emericellopsis atlantica TaxID=2614577 RepID=A0A9P7ZR26_9HYPO|nr:uncharacterized protein F5Z01DRAFT_617694 [Emericellopsis atlantica]KAG9256645.1 hypothetical protein F5Z01DRAFT_617694 [Emericellopsis atlantica]
MEKIFKRARQAERQVVRRAKLREHRERIRTRIQVRDELRDAGREHKSNMELARKIRQERWEMGPIAPRRQIGVNGYGLLQRTVHFDASVDGAHTPKRDLVVKRCAWAGGVKRLNLAVGDRVVIMEGVDKGRIDHIATIDLTFGTVTLRNIHKVCSVGEHQMTTLSSLPIPIDAVRLVYPILDPETGVMKDTIIHQLKGTAANMKSENMTLARWDHGKRWDRFVPGANIVIPWPEVEAPNHRTHDCDTVRSQVESRSFFYNLLTPPMPPAVLDELRNKYSKFRTRHEDWYIAKKEHEAAAKSRRNELLKEMQTPSDEARIRRDALKEAKGEPELTDEMLEKLGEIIAQTKAVSLKDSGVSGVEKSE